MRTWSSYLPRALRVLLLLLLVAACASPRPPLDERELDTLRQAYGSRPESWAVRGAYRDGAGKGTFEDRFARDGRFARRHRSAVVGGAGFDGEHAWNLPIDELARPSSGQTALEARVTASVLTGSWLAEGSGIEARALDRNTLELIVAGRRGATLHLDPLGRLPTELTFGRGSGGLRRLVLADWLDPLGFPIAHRVELRDESGLVATWRTESVTAEAGSFSAPAPPADTTFLDPQIGLPARLAGARILVEVRAETEEAGWWLVDTGAGSSAVSPALADRLGWPTIGAATLIGAGGRTSRGLRRSGLVTVGPLEVQGLPMVEAEVSDLSLALGVPVSGVLGADILARCVLDLDFTAGRARMIDPSLWVPPPGAAPVTTDGVVPVLQARFAPGHTGRLRLDTGSNDTVTFHGPTVRRLGLATGRDDLKTVVVRGVGGEARGDRAPLDWLEVAGQRFVGLPVTFLRHSKGGLARSDLAGNLGAGLFAGRRVVLALPHRCVVIE